MLPQSTQIYFRLCTLWIPNLLNELDQYLLPQIRELIEERYYARINEQARLEHIRDINLVLHAPYPALWADHGVVHVRNVAENIVHVLNVANGVMLPQRSAERLAFMKAYGVMLAYVHDIGMLDFSHFGRVIHPEFATQAVMSAPFDDIIQAIWKENRGVVVERLTRLSKAGTFKVSPTLVLRELLSMANAHSKSKVPGTLLNHRSQLRHVMQKTVRTDLQTLFQEEEVAKARQALSVVPKLELGKPEINQLADALRDANKPATRSLDDRGYKNFQRESYHWLIARDATTRVLADDVIDTLRALRCADALRQRGTVLKTSGQYEIFVDQRTANAVYALRLADNRLFLLEVPDYVGAGEANIASSELERAGDLRISFHRGAFATPEALQRALYSAALIVNDLQSDVLESFVRTGKLPHGKRAQDMGILLEDVDDNLDFADQVAEQLEHLNPHAAEHTHTVPSLKNISAAERKRYIEAAALKWNTAERRAALQQIAHAGHKTEGIDPDKAFEHVKRLELSEGATLIEPDTPAGFVYIPLEEGLEILPLGGYASLAAQPWIPIGVTGVIRGSTRNAEVIARCEVALLMIPKDVYMKHWHTTYTTEELRELLSASR